jgi:protein phosphatase
MSAPSILIVADVHGNLPALAAVLEKERDCDSVAFLGDAVDYGPFPRETLALLKSTPALRIMGNHDMQMLSDAPTDDLWTSWTRQAIDAEDRLFIRTFLGPHIVSWGGRRVLLHHGEALDGERKYMLPDDPDEVYAAVSSGDAELVIFGHSHIPFRRRVGRRLFVNPGAVGQQRDGTTTAKYAVFKGGEIELRECAYNLSTLLVAMDALGLPCTRVDAWANALSNGRIPS